MKNINWKQKLTSRKFWVSLVGFATSIMIAFGADSSTQAQVTAIIMAGASLIAYTLAEGFVDGNRSNDNTDEVNDKGDN